MEASVFYFTFVFVCAFPIDWDTCHVSSPLGYCTSERKREEGERKWCKRNQADKDTCRTSRQVAQHGLAAVNVIDIGLTSKTETHTHTHTNTQSYSYLYSLISLSHLFTCPLMPARKMSCISIVLLGRVCH